MTGNVFNIQRFSLHDGPGIRTTFFLMGCSLKCRWCHNPEGLSTRIRLQFDGRECIGCGACFQVCRHEGHSMGKRGHEVAFEKCVGCGKCVEVCPSKALEFSGKEYTPQELAEKGMLDRLFYKENGGITFSGGEPLLQADFVAETARLAKEAGVPTVGVDTAGNVCWEAFEKVLPVTDFFLFDVKAAREETHRKGTGCSNRQILKNLKALSKTGKKLFIRIPVIPTINDSDEEMKAIGNIVRGLEHVEEVRLLPYHTFGREKYEILGLPQPEQFPVPDARRMEEMEKLVKA